jgi:hypothetical protein
MTEPQAAYVTESVTPEDNHKNTPWLCKSCGAALGYVHFDRTRLVMHCADLCVTVYGYAIVTCHKCGGEQEWIAAGEHKLMRKIAKHGVDY